MPIGKNCHSGHRWGCADRAGDDFRASRVHRHRSSPTLPSAAPYVLYISQVSYKSCEHNIKLTKQAKAPFIPLGSSQVVALWPARWEIYYIKRLFVLKGKSYVSLTARWQKSQRTFVFPGGETGRLSAVSRTK